MITVFARTSEILAQARDAVAAFVDDLEVGREYLVTVSKFIEYGAIVNFDDFPGKEGFLHVSEISHARVRRPDEELALGDKFKVRFIAYDTRGRPSVSRKSCMPPPIITFVVPEAEKPTSPEKKAASLAVREEKERPPKKSKPRTSDPEVDAELEDNDSKWEQ